ncbi:MAG: hypothetical protein ABIW76_12255, partial [Fibrobacteria bacterium]
MIDSVTAGAVRLEYSEESPNNNTYASGRTYGINQKLYYYNFETDSLFFFAPLNENLSGLPSSISYFKDVDFNYPLLLYITSLNGNTITSIYDIEKKSNVLSTPFRGFLSSERKYIVGKNQIMDLSNTDTSSFVNTNNGDLFYFDDTTGSGYGVASALRNPPYPIFKYGLRNVLPESVGVLNLFRVLGRSPFNETMVIQLLNPTSLGLLKLDSLKNGIVASEVMR